MTDWSQITAGHWWAHNSKEHEWLVLLETAIPEQTVIYGWGYSWCVRFCFSFKICDFEFPFWKIIPVEDIDTY